MPGHGLGDLGTAPVGITIPAKMSTGIIRPNITVQKTGTFLPGTGDFGRTQFAVERLLIDGKCHAAAAVGTVRRKFRSFSARLYGHPVLSRNTDKIGTQIQSHFLGNGLDLRKIFPYFGVQINKTNNTSFCITSKCRRYFFKLEQMFLGCILRID